MKLCVLLFLLLVSCSTTEDLTGKSLYDKLQPAGVEILVNGQRSGSGAIVSEDGYILTAAHIFHSKAKYTMMNSAGLIKDLKLTAVDRSSDLALVKADLRGSPFLSLSKTDVDPGQEVYQYGAAFYRSGMMQKGWLCDSEPSFEYYGSTSRHGVEIRHISTTVQPGTSGGPWVNLKGELVGVQSGIMTINNSNSGMAFAAPLYKIRKLVESKKSAKTPTLEIVVETLANQRPPVVKNYNGKTGAVIVGVLKNGAAEKQGIEKDDLILAVNSEKVLFDHDYYRLVRSIPAGIEFELKICKPGKEGAVKTLNVKAVVLEDRFKVGFPE